MPNWTNNEVTIKGDIAKIAEGLAEGKELFSLVYPKPDDIEDWYSWNVNNWGTKWDTNAEIVEVTEDSISLSFDTAWAPPIAFYDKLAELGFEVNATFFESGMMFVGEYVDGEVGVWDLDSKDIPDHLMELWNIEEYLENIRETS